jgi:hypothetical protein
VTFRVFYRFLRLIDPLVRSWLASGLPGLDGVVDLRVTGRRSGRRRHALVTLMTVDDTWYLGHPNGPTSWVRNVDAAGVVDLDPPAAFGSRFRAIRLPSGPERDAVIRATWRQQPFPANLIYRAARRHIAAVGVYHRLEPVPKGSGPAPPDSANPGDP